MTPADPAGWTKRRGNIETMRPLAIALLLLIAGCSRAPVATEPGEDALDSEIAVLRQLEEDLAAAWGARDAGRIVSYYATDAFVQLAGRPIIDQIDAIRHEVSTMIQDPALALTWTVDTIEIGSGGDIAWSRGRYSSTYTDPATSRVMSENGNFVNTYRKVNDGSWKVVADVPTPSGPAVAKSK